MEKDFEKIDDKYQRKFSFSKIEMLCNSVFAIQEISCSLQSKNCVVHRECPHVTTTHMGTPPTPHSDPSPEPHPATMYGPPPILLPKRDMFKGVHLGITSQKNEWPLRVYELNSFNNKDSDARMTVNR